MNEGYDNHIENQKNEPSSIPVWPGQTVTPITTSPTPPPKKSRRWLIIIGSALLILACALVGFIVFSSQSNSCFSANNYQGLVDIITPADSDNTSISDVQAQQLLYIHSVYFSQGTVDFNAEVSPEDPTDFLQSIGAYYQAQHAAAPFSVLISTSYTGADSLNLAQQRISKVKNVLQQAGLDASVITSSQPTLVPLNAETSEDDDLVDGIPVLVSITPTSRCSTQK